MKLYWFRLHLSGATASNILAISIAREYLISSIQRVKHNIPNYSVSDSGTANISISIFTAGAHSSIAKSASILGIGKNNVEEITTQSEDEMCEFDLVELERRMKSNWENGVGSIVVSSFGEVNTGGFTSNTKKLRDLCDEFGGWLHIDAGKWFSSLLITSSRFFKWLFSTNFYFFHNFRLAFGAFAVLHSDFAYLSEEMALADSITSDAHKCMSCSSIISFSTNSLFSPLYQGWMFLTIAEFSSLDQILW